jgi:hypothetical protein
MLYSSGAVDAKFEIILKYGKLVVPVQDIHKHDLLANEEALHELLFEFSNNRNWIQYYDNRGLSLSLLSELGEVCAALEYCKNGPVSNKTWQRSWPR